MADSHPLVITLSGERPLREVTADLEAAGLKIDQVLSEVGIVTGSAPAGAAARLRRVTGVADVSKDHGVDIGPPGSPVS
jgi:hypothetical protein